MLKNQVLSKKYIYMSTYHTNSMFTQDFNGKAGFVHYN